jgi:hypothetical protein
MPKFSDHIEWDEDRDRPNPKGTDETENPFDDPQVQRRMSELIVRAALGIKERYLDSDSAARRKE